VTVEIFLVLAVLLVAIVLFITEWLRMDLVALLVLGSLAALNLVTPLEALSGFSNAAVVTVWAMFIISGGLSKTGVANLLGRQVMRMAGNGEGRLVAVIMLTAAIMSAFMNNVGVAAMLLPVVLGIARSTGRAPSRLLMPLAYGSLLGGLTTLIGTPPNILVSDALREYGLTPFRLFDFTPIGGVIMIVGIAFVTLLGRHLLPNRDPVRESAGRDRDYHGDYKVGERLFVLRLSTTTPLAGKTLAQSRLGSALRLNVLAIIRRGQPHLSPRPEVVLQPGDRLLVQGDLDYLSELRDQQHLVIDEDSLPLEQVLAQEIGLVEARLAPDSAFVGQTLYQAHWRSGLDVNVLAIRRSGTVRHTNLQDTALEAQDVLLLQGRRERLEKLAEEPDFETVEPIAEEALARVYNLDERFLALHVPDDSQWVGKSLVESRIGDAFGFTVLGIVRNGATHFMPDPDERLQAGDTLMVKGAPEMLATLAVLRGLQELEIEREVPSAWAELESPEVGLSEVVLSPETTLEGKTLRELNFREKYGLTVLAIWRRGTAYRTDLRDMALRFGDAVLVYGPRQKLRVLGREPDFLVLTEGEQEPPRVEKAPVSIAIMVAILLPVFFGWLPISIAAVIGAALMVLSRCLTMEEAYRFIEWPAVFLIAGMLPLGIALEQTGAAVFLADGVISVMGGMGPRPVLAGIYILTSLATQVIPTAALVVLMAPIAMNTAADLGLSPLPLMMTMAIAASASFSSPVSHPANVLVMGPGGYRFVDYLKLGLPLTLVILILVVLLVPIFWPL
jgi:di/tricarboxylate transporter